MTGRPREPRRGRRGLAKLRAEQTACIRGHQFDVVNTRWQVDAAGYLHRQCRRCARGTRSVTTHGHDETEGRK
ncbi:MAG: hypothetical protein EPN51_11990 [Mycobacterium sp.]|nr:MAG: hypothetical protein EPN51_11990 [Mycobacterium sp.]